MFDKKGFTLVEFSDGRRMSKNESSPVSEDNEPTKPKACRRSCPSTRKIRLVKAFTLAEVLIVLAIIGVVAALAIPTLSKFTQDRELVSVFLKSNAVLSNAFKEAEATEEIKVDKIDDISAFRDFFEHHLKVLDSNISGGTTLCGNDVCLMDGISLNYGSFQTGCTTEVPNQSSSVFKNSCIKLTVDINGKKLPNRPCKDRYNFWVTKYGIFPEGKTDTCSGLDCGNYIVLNKKLYPNCSATDSGE